MYETMRWIAWYSKYTNTTWLRRREYGTFLFLGNSVKEFPVHTPGD